MRSTSIGYVEILRSLARERVDAIVVGAVAAVLQGAPISTFDVDVVHARDPDNVQRLLRVLADLDAVFRNDPRGLRPTASHLAGPGHQLLRTRLGDLDCLGVIGPPGAELGYEELLPRSSEMDIGEGLRCRVLDLQTIIEVKRAIGRPKDIAALPVLLATLDEARTKHRPER